MPSLAHDASGSRIGCSAGVTKAAARTERRTVADERDRHRDGTGAGGSIAMADWDHGYVSDVSYTAGFHRETAPAWIATVATCLNSVPPDIANPFRYADLGCGNGVTALVVAATMPHADVWAFDFNPAHIHSGRDVARRAGLTNIHFEEASFEDLACRPPGALPMFDYIAAHGVISWISHENKRHVFDVIGRPRVASERSVGDRPGRDTRNGERKGSPPMPSPC
jgi:SAM-dependent methyltransferase